MLFIIPGSGPNSGGQAAREATGFPGPLHLVMTLQKEKKT